MTNEEINIEEFLYNPESIDSEEFVRIPFGRDNLNDLEEKMNGGFIGGKLYILGGPPNSCKTMLLNNIADNICLNDYPVLYFSFDDSKSEVCNKTFARFSKYNIEDFNKKLIPPEDIKQIYQDENIDKIFKHKYIIEENIKIEEWDNLIEQVIEKHEKHPIILIDYLRKIDTIKELSDGKSKIDYVVPKLTEISKLNNIPILLISELARGSYSSKQNFTMSSFKESGVIEYEGSWLGIVYNILDDQSTTNIELNILKANSGTGDKEKVRFKTNITEMSIITENDYFDMTLF